MFKYLVVSFVFSCTAYAEECSSDFNCGVGQKCVKGYLQSTGECMNVVDKYGVKRYNPPSTESILPKTNSKGMCSFDTDCNIGFECKKDGSIYGNCVKKP